MRVGLMCWKRLGVLILLGILLAACGNKGPLVFPDADNKVEKAERELTN